jgi:hypothetical protein
MPQPDILEPHNWQRIHEQIDQSVAEAARAYLRTLTLRRIRFDRDELLSEIGEFDSSR